jgi:hypothetical protein
MTVSCSVDCCSHFKFTGFSLSAEPLHFALHLSNVIASRFKILFLVVSCFHLYHYSQELGHTQITTFRSQNSCLGKLKSSPSFGFLDCRGAIPEKC